MWKPQINACPTQEKIKIKLKPIQDKLKAFEEAKVICDKTAAKIKVRRHLVKIT